MPAARPVIHPVVTRHDAVTLAAQLADLPGTVLLHSARAGGAQSRFSLVATRPFLTFRAFGARCEIRPARTPCGEHLPSADPLPWHGRLSSPADRVQFGNPWCVLDALLGRYELPDEPDLPFPLGGCFGFWGYDLKNFVEPKLPRRAERDLDLPDCHVGFYHSLVVFDQQLRQTWIIATGLAADGSRSERRARHQLRFWQEQLEQSPRAALPPWRQVAAAPRLTSNLSRAQFLDRVARAQRYIRAGDIYQVNLSQRLAAPLTCSSWELFERLTTTSPAPFAAYLDAGDFQLASSSPELFLRLRGAHVVTRPIKGTRPRGADAGEDARLARELQTSAKENAELVMITDLLRNDLGRVCEFGSVRVPELARLERYAQVQHLVATIEGRLRPDVTHLGALAACFPGGSITGAPKFRAMEVIDELEPTARGPYTGALGYLGFNRQSQLSILIRVAICAQGRAVFPVGAGIVADSTPEAEYEETLAKAAGFVAALGRVAARPCPVRPARRPPAFVPVAP